MASKMLLATDGSEPAKDAASFAIKLASKLGMELVALRVVDIDRYTSDWEAVRNTVTKELEDHALRILRDVRDEAEKSGVSVDPQIRHGDSSREIIRFARENPEVTIIIMGASGRRRLGRQLIGSTAERVVRQVGSDLPCSVIIAPSRSTQPEARLGI